jgi:hypothetical protein
MQATATVRKVVGLGGFARRRIRAAIWSAVTVASVVVLAPPAATAATITTTGVITSNTALKLCPSASVLSGLNVDVESRGYVDEIVLLCRSGNGNVVSGPMIGIPGTIPQGFLMSSCAPPMVAVGIYGRSGDVLDAIGIRCAGPGQPPVNATLEGGPGGAPRGPFDCPAGLQLIGLQGKSSSDYYGAPDVTSVTGICGSRSVVSSRPARGHRRHRPPAKRRT